MDRRRFLGQSLVGVAGETVAIEAPLIRAEPTGSNRRYRPLAPEYTVLWRALDPMHEIGYCPALARLPGGRLIGCMLHAGSDVEKQREWTVKVHTSDDRGRTWTHRVDVPMIDCFPFAAGSSVYVIGGRHDLTIIRSDDQGTTWTPPVKLTKGKLWYCHPGSAVLRERAHLLRDGTDHGAHRSGISHARLRAGRAVGPNVGRPDQARRMDVFQHAELSGRDRAERRAESSGRAVLLARPIQASDLLSRHGPDRLG